jgi:hypothetical protein
VRITKEIAEMFQDKDQPPAPVSPTPVHDAERERLKRKDFIQTFSGRAVRPLDMRPEDVCLEDIAHALSMKCRYTGHTTRFYSVAEHCVRVSRIVPPAFALPGLLHDAGEAYLPDLAAPIKRAFWVNPPGPSKGPDTFAQVEGRVLDAIFAGLGLSALRSVAESEQVKKADLIMLATEAGALMKFSGRPGDPTLEDWGLTEKPHVFGYHDVLGWSPELAEEQFLQRYAELAGGTP